jgi:hypothetical protein
MSKFQSLDPVNLEEVEGFSATPVFEELFDAIVSSELSESSAGLEGETPLIKLGPSAQPTGNRLRTILLGAAALILIAAGLTAIFQQEAPSGREITPWHAARSLVSHAPRPALGGGGSWQVVDDLLSSSWQQNTAGPPPGGIDCPSVSACYALSESYPSPRADAPLLSVSLYVSSDLGNTWSVLPVPKEFDPTTALTCGTALTCSVGGTMNDKPIFLSTSDGGHQWSIDSYSGPGVLERLDCTGPDVCSGASVPTDDARHLLGGLDLIGASFPWSLVHTDNGGQSWSSHPLASGDFVTGFSCARTMDCVVTGSDGVRVGGSYGGFVWYTTDGGSTWKSGIAPANFMFRTPAVSCSTATDCMAIGLTSIPNPHPCIDTPAGRGPPPGANSCTTSSSELVSGVVVTSDGGRTWRSRSLPADVPLPQLMSISCASSTVCWLAGQEAVPIQIGNTFDGGSSVILGTRDAGNTWQKVTFTVPPGAPNYYGQSYLSMGPISCPTTRACVAIGAVAQGAKSTPIYRYEDS